MSELPTSEYYAGRAMAERRLAQAAADPRAGAAHGELAARYEALAADPSLELPGADLADEELADGELPDNLVQPYVELPALRAG